MCGLVVVVCFLPSCVPGSLREASILPLAASLSLEEEEPGQVLEGAVELQPFEWEEDGDDEAGPGSGLLLTVVVQAHGRPMARIRVAGAAVARVGREAVVRHVTRVLPQAVAAMLTGAREGGHGEEERRPLIYGAEPGAVCVAGVSLWQRTQALSVSRLAAGRLSCRLLDLLHGATAAHLLLQLPHSLPQSLLLLSDSLRPGDPCTALPLLPWVENLQHATTEACLLAAAAGGATPRGPPTCATLYLVRGQASSSSTGGGFLELWRLEQQQHGPAAAAAGPPAWLLAKRLGPAGRGALLQHLHHWTQAVAAATGLQQAGQAGLDMAAEELMGDVVGPDHDDGDEGDEGEAVEQHEEEEAGPALSVPVWASPPHQLIHKLLRDQQQQVHRQAGARQAGRQLSSLRPSPPPRPS